MTDNGGEPAPAGKRPVDSAITQFLNHLEVAMWGRGVPPDTAVEVLNAVLWGHPAGPAAWEELQVTPQGDRLGLLTAQFIEYAQVRSGLTDPGQVDRWERHVKGLLAQVFTLGLSVPARQDAEPAVVDSPQGWVKGFQPMGGGCVLLRCHNPDGGPEVFVRVSRFELESVLIALAVAPGSQAPARQQNT